MASAETIYGSVTGYIWEEDGDRIRYIPEEALTESQKTFIENNYSAGGPLNSDLSGLSDPGTGFDAQSFYAGYAIWYDPSYPRRVANQEVPQVSASYDQAEINAIVDAVNAIRQLV